MSKKVYKKISNIPDAGLGLFAGENIKKGSIITEFIGVKTSNPTDHWSVIHFYGDRNIQCNKTNLASYANDVIIFPKVRRDFVKIINNNEDFYETYNNQGPNACIYQNDNLFRAWLKATRDIKKDEEIFIHYGLQFWFKKEMAIKNETDTIETELGLPSYIFESDSFKRYVNKFYPDVVKIVPERKNGVEIVKLITKGDEGYILDINMFLN